MTTGYTYNQRIVFDEALRAVPGMLACKMREDWDGSRVLAMGVLNRASELGMCSAEAWSVMFSACLNWYMQATFALARERGDELGSVVGQMTTLASLWEANAT